MITEEDVERTGLYQREAERKASQISATDMPSYLASLEMVASVRRFVPIDLPRISQLINKSNQFNLTTVRRSEAEVAEVMSDGNKISFTVRLRDRFGEHGLIAVVIGSLGGTDLEIDTWLMSCRVLKRQVEEVTLNELARLARERHCTRLVGRYRPTAKNGLVAEHYPTLGFSAISVSAAESVYEMDLTDYRDRATAILVEGVADDYV
jgi:FkbH-like protein